MRLPRGTHALPALFLFACSSETPVGPSYGNDAAAADAAAADAATEAVDSAVPPPVDAGPAKVGVFVANGHVGRSIVSCDDGKSWQFDQSLNAAIRCFENGKDCDHDSGAAAGLAFSNGWFLRANGHGAPGLVTRSRNGIAWETVVKDASVGGVAAQNGIVVLGARTPKRSANDGTTFTDGTDGAIDGWNVRGTSAAAGRFWMIGDDGSDVGNSTDGTTWTKVKTIPKECGTLTRDGNFAALGSTIVLIGQTNGFCRSTDNGVTWTKATFPSDSAPATKVLTSHDAFYVWQFGALLRSTDGLTWTRTPTVPANIEVGAVAVSDAPAGTQTFVAIRGGWTNWYEKQSFYRSTDGVTWTTLAATEGPGGHPMANIAWGLVDASLACK